MSERLRSWYGADEAVLCGSGTQALRLAIEVAGTLARTRAGGEQNTAVALPAYSCYDLVTAALGAGAEMHFYDVDPTRLAPVESDVSRNLGEGARIVVVSPLYGVPVPWDRLKGIVDGADGVLIEDAAQGIGASWNGRPLGSLGELSVLSFGRGKGWTGAGGGALLARGVAADVLRSRIERAPLPTESRGLGPALASWGQWALRAPALYAVPSRIPALGLGETRWHAPGPVQRIAQFSARLALETRSRSLSAVEDRRARAACLSEIFGDVKSDGVELIRPPKEGIPGYLRWPLLVRGGLTRLPNAAGLRRAGVARGYPAALPDLPGLIGDLAPFRERFFDREGDFPGARKIVRELVTLPVHRYASETVADRLLSGVASS